MKALEGPLAPSADALIVYTSAGALGIVIVVWMAPDWSAAVVAKACPPFQLIWTAAPDGKPLPVTVTAVPEGPVVGLRPMLADGMHAQASAARVSDTASTLGAASKVQRRLELILFSAQIMVVSYPKGDSNTLLGVRVRPPKSEAFAGVYAKDTYMAAVQVSGDGKLDAR